MTTDATPWTLRAAATLLAAALSGVTAAPVAAHEGDWTPSAYTDSVRDGHPLEGDASGPLFDLYVARAFHGDPDAQRYTDRNSISAGGHTDEGSDTPVEVTVALDADGDRTPDAVLYVRHQPGVDPEEFATSLHVFEGDGRYPPPGRPDSPEITCDLASHRTEAMAEPSINPRPPWAVQVSYPEDCLDSHHITLTGARAATTLDGRPWQDLAPDEPEAYAVATVPGEPPDRNTEPRDATSRGIELACPEGQVPDHPFEDIRGTAHEGAIACLHWWGIVDGVDGTTYEPDATISTWQAASLLTRLLEASGATIPSARYRHVAHDGTHHDAINRLLEYAAIDLETEFPLDLHRHGLVEWLVTLHPHRTGVELPGPAGDHFDDDLDPMAYRNDVAATAGLTTGVASRTFDGSRPITRGQTAAVLARYLDLLVEAGHAPSP